MAQKVLLGISGGIDSFVSTLLLQEQGYEVVGICFEFWNKGDLSAVQELYDSLGITLLQRNEKENFKKLVIEPFIQDYTQARTPSPCCICNSRVKWQLLDQVAQELDIPFIATGHYVNIVHEQDTYYIQQGKDPIKDQSYFLWNMPQHILSRSITPLGNYTKTQVRNIALERGYKTILARRESMSICFLEGQDYRNFITQHSHIHNTLGPIYTTDGTHIGQHDGLLNYTIGQKRGIPTPHATPLYVASMCVETNSIVVDTKENLHTLELTIGQINIPNPQDILAHDITVKVRGLGLNPTGYAVVKEIDHNTLHIRLSTPAWAIAPGQPVALYRNNRVIGGGIAV